MTLLIFSTENVNLTMTSPSFILFTPSVPPKKRQMTLIRDIIDLRVASKFLNSLKIRD